METLNITPNGKYINVFYHGCFDGTECISSTFMIPKKEYMKKQEEIANGNSAIFDGKYGKICVYQNGFSEVVFKPSGDSICFDEDSSKDIIKKLLIGKNLESLI
jgi:hypothetical protein